MDFRFPLVSDVANDVVSDAVIDAEFLILRRLGEFQ